MFAPKLQKKEKFKIRLEIPQLVGQIDPIYQIQRRSELPTILRSLLSPPSSPLPQTFFMSYFMSLDISMSSIFPSRIFVSCNHQEQINLIDFFDTMLSSPCFLIVAHNQLLAEGPCVFGLNGNCQQRNSNLQFTIFTLLNITPYAIILPEPSISEFRCLTFVRPGI